MTETKFRDLLLSTGATVKDLGEETVGKLKQDFIVTLGKEHFIVSASGPCDGPIMNCVGDVLAEKVAG